MWLAMMMMEVLQDDSLIYSTQSLHLADKVNSDIKLILLMIIAVDVDC